MSVLLVKIKLTDSPDEQGDFDDSIDTNVLELSQLGAAEIMAGPLPQADGDADWLILVAIPPVDAVSFDIDTLTTLGTEVMGVRWYNGSLDSLQNTPLRALRAAWDASRE